MAQIVTTFSFEGFHAYGSRFIDSFVKHWPQYDDLAVYSDKFVDVGRAEFRGLSQVEGLGAFKARHTGPLANGRTPMPCWKRKDHDDGYSFKTDAVKFSNKVFVVRDAAYRLREGFMAWIDADVIVTARPPEFAVKTLLGDADVAYLGRDGVHSECGFLAFRLPQALPLIDTWAQFYRDDTVFGLKEWHDSYVFDMARQFCVHAVKQRNMTPGGYGHVWEKSPLNSWSVHQKGDRKGQPIPERTRA